MRDLLLFTTDAQGRVRITQGPAVGQNTIFSEYYLLSRSATEPAPGVVTFPDLLVDSIITVTPGVGQPRTFKIVDIRPYEDAQGDVPFPNLMVYYTLRLS